ncbi:hypothetical protein [Rickettsia endosymbiont of Cantharis rufa]
MITNIFLINYNSSTFGINPIVKYIELGEIHKKYFNFVAKKSLSGFMP